MSTLSDDDVLQPTDSDDSEEATNAVSREAAEGNGTQQQRRSQQRRGPMFTAVEDLLVAKAYIKASESAIGNKQKLAIFYVQLATVYAALKKEQEDEDNREASQSRVPQMVPVIIYPARTGSSIYQHFNKKILPSVIKFMGVVQQNPRKSGEDDTEYHNCLSTMYKEKFGEYFRYLACYYFLREKPKFVSLIDDGRCQGDGMKKRSAGSKDNHAVNKKAKQLRNVEEFAEPIGATLDIAVEEGKKENNTMSVDNNVDQKVLVGDALKEIARIMRAGLSSWERSIYFEYADENLQQQLANACVRHEIMRLENEMEQMEDAKSKKYT